MTPRTGNIYGLGAMIYDLLTGRPPFQGETLMDTVVQVARAQPEPPRQVRTGACPATWSGICLKCLEKDPRQRYSTAEVLAEDLEAYMRGEPVLVEVGSEARLMRRLLRETRHTEVMALWGRVWMWHAVQVFLLFLISNALVWAGTVPGVALCRPLGRRNVQPADPGLVLSLSAAGRR